MKHLFISQVRLRLAIISSIALILFFSACKRDTLVATEQFTNQKVVTATISGQVFDEFGVPLEAASIEVGTSTYITGSDGAFFFKDILVKENAQLIKVVKSGYFDGFRTLKIQASKDHFTRIAVYKKDNAQTFDAVQGKVIVAANGAKIKFSPNSIISSLNGQAYNGTVTVFAKTIRANDPNIAQLMIGDLRGINTNGSEKGLSTFGMLGVELTDDLGNALNIAPGKTAEITMPIPSDQLSYAESTIPLWHFDEIKAMWVEDGSATKIGNEYVGTVSHFSWWNLDLPIRFVTFYAKFVEKSSGLAISNSLIKISSPNMGAFLSYTNSKGEVHYFVPERGGASTVNITIIEPICNQNIFTDTKNIQSGDVDLGTIEVVLPNVQNVATINGNVVDCNANPLANAPVSILVNNQLFTQYSDASGKIKWSALLCNPGIPCKITAYDFTAFKSGSISTNINFGLNAVGNIAACGAIIENMVYTLNSPTKNLSFSFVDPTAQFFTTPQGATTVFTVQDAIGSTNSNLSIFKFNGGQTAGLFDISSIYKQYYSGSTLVYVQSDPTTAVPINIKEFGASLGEYINGTFNGSFLDTVSKETFVIDGKFNLKRDW